jgi:SOS-response transcriptional repressor LexA
MPTIQKTLKILGFIEAYQSVHSQAPTLRTVADKFGLRSVGSIHRHIAIMQSRGWVNRPRYQRWIEIVTPEHRRAA